MAHHRDEIGFGLIELLLFGDVRANAQPGDRPAGIVPNQGGPQVDDDRRAILANHLEEAPTDWDGIKLAAMHHWRRGRNPQALEFAQLLVTIAPWKAESYDWLAFIAEKTGHASLLAFAKAKGDQVFADETRLYDDLRSTLDQ